jgi:hypothetical protein
MFALATADEVMTIVRNHRLKKGDTPKTRCISFFELIENISKLRLERDKR